MGHIELRALAGLGDESFENRSGNLPKRQTCGGPAAERHEPRSEDETSGAISAEKTVLLQRSGETMSSGPVEPCRFDESGQRQRPLLDGDEDRCSLVQHPDIGRYT